MKTVLYSTICAFICLALGLNQSHGQTQEKNFLVLTSQDTVFGRTVLKFANVEKRYFFKVGKPRYAQFFNTDTVAAFRITGTDFIMKPDLHSEKPVPYHTVLAKGEACLIGQQCSDCEVYLSLHVILKDGREICVNKENYYSEIIPALCQTQGCVENFSKQHMRYSIFSDILIKRLVSLVDYYNQNIETEAE